MNEKKTTKLRETHMKFGESGCWMAIRASPHFQSHANNDQRYQRIFLQCDLQFLQNELKTLINELKLKLK